MDFVNKSYSQVSDLFRSMTPGARITTGLLLAVVAASMLFLFRYQTDHADEYLFGGETVTQGELVAIEAAFGTEGLSHYEFVGNKVKVPRLQRHAYLAALGKNSALPQNFGSASAAMLASNSTFDTRDIREHKLRFAQEKDLAKIVREMPDIQEATVKIQDMPAPAFGAAKERRALVAVKPMGTKRIDAAQLTMIRQTVASGSGVKAEFVTVTDLNGHVSPGVGKDNGASEFENLYGSNQQMFIDKYTRIISQRLSNYPGLQIGVSVELDKDIHNQIISQKYDEKPTSIATTTLTKDSSSTAGEAGGRPGAAANQAVGPTPTQVAAGPSTESKNNESREDTKGVVGATQNTITKAPLVPTSVSVSIGIPRSYFVTIWHQKNPPAPGEAAKTPPADQLKVIEAEKIKEIEDAVVILLPPPPKGDDKYKPVNVQPYDETPLAQLEPPTLAENAFDWLAMNWQTLGLFALAAFGVLFVRGMVRAAHTELPNPVESHDNRASMAAALEEEEQAASQETAETAANTLKKKFQTSGRGLRDELTELVREDPDAAANVLKLWISDAA